MRRSAASSVLPSLPEAGGAEEDSFVERRFIG